MFKLPERFQSRLYNTWPRYKNIGFITLYIVTQEVEENRLAVNRRFTNNLRNPWNNPKCHLQIKSPMLRIIMDTGNYIPIISAPGDGSSNLKR
uniref:GIY-YIG domain-containing protein n=1 Tax=Loa loa TaxID=7209 RepID=A0A1I7VGS6_LOALO